ncbi:LPS-assembly protein LptD [bioreactor metagenome]|uniref:LPS-assembly protein LptD n=1 Tax=bioreactor metagenome TaxID=1076179 RepID=A0A644ZPR3_9ZZZZ
MFDTKKALFGLLALVMVFGSIVPGYAAEKKPTDDKKQSAAGKKSAVPITIEGDELSFSDKTGQVFAKGNVVVTQNDVQLTTDLLNGDTKQSLVWTDSPATMIQPGIKLVGTGLNFNYKENTGDLDKVSGKVNKQFVTGQNIEMKSTKELIINGGTVTTCPAIVPDYHVSAEKIEIWPGEKMIAHNAKFWIKDKVIFSLPKYQTSLKKDEGESQFPRIGYDSDDGVFISQYLEYPVTDNIAIYGDLGYYSKRGFDPTYGLVSRQTNYTLNAFKGEFKNGDDEWIQKEPEIEFRLNPQRLGNSGLTANFFASTGRWKEGSVSGWRQDYNLYLSADPIKLSNVFSLKLGAGFEKLNYGYNDTTNNIWHFDTMLNAKANDKLDIWTGYSYRNQSGLSPYVYDRIDISRELTSGFSYKIDRLNGFKVNTSYNLDTQRFEDVDYTWQRNLHCWDAEITYREKRDQVKMKISAAKW